MEWYEILIIAVVSAFVIGVFTRKIIKIKRGEGCSDCCSDCNACPYCKEHAKKK
ncbi:MAG: hypothetical protein PHX51_04590 [Clostridia bacterium]|nr:hypothetical protein [Clostridia bacterium]